MLIPSKVWVVDRWVTFSLNIGDYQNIITFFDDNGLSFLTMLALDFTQIPVSLHGKGNSTNLLDYLSNNTDNNTLISQFLNYFLNTIIIISYSSGQKMNFNFNGNTGWQNMTFSVYSPYIPPTTTTTTILITTTTTISPTTSTTTTTILSTTTTTTIPFTTILPTTTTTILPITTTTTTLNLGSVVTNAISGITDIGATAYVTITRSGETSIILCGVVWATTPGAKWGDDARPGDESNSASDKIVGVEYAVSILDLLSRTTYFARAFLRTASGTTYGNEIEFITPVTTTTTTVTPTTTTTTVTPTTTTTTVEPTTTTTTDSPTTTTTTTVATEFYYLTTILNCLNCIPSTTDFPITDSRSDLTINKYYFDTISTDIFQITGTHTFGVQSTNLTGPGSDTCGELSCATTTTTTTTTTPAPTTTTTTGPTTTTTIGPTTTTTTGPTTTTTTGPTTTTTTPPTTTTTTTSDPYNYYTVDEYTCSGGACGVYVQTYNIKTLNTLSIGGWGLDPDTLNAINIMSSTPPGAYNITTYGVSLTDCNNVCNY